MGLALLWPYQCGVAGPGQPSISKLLRQSCLRRALRLCCLGPHLYPSLNLLPPSYFTRLVCLGHTAAWGSHSSSISSVYSSKLKEPQQFRLTMTGIMLCHGRDQQINYIVGKEEMGKIWARHEKNTDFYFKMKSYILRSRTKHSQAWQHRPIIPNTWQTEAWGPQV